jgi:hypothetical protein
MPKNREGSGPICHSQLLKLPNMAINRGFWQAQLPGNLRNGLVRVEENDDGLALVHVA